MKKIFLMALLISAAQITVAQTLRVMTYNIRLNNPADGENAWPHRKDFLVNQIRFHEPDIFGIQEGKPEQVQYLDQELQDYEYFGIGRDEGKGEHSAIYYKKERFKVADSNTFWLSETPEKTSKGWDAAFPRVCTYGLFFDRESKNRFWVFNTHLDHRGEIARKESIKIILSWITRLNHKNYPVVLTGDFNVPPNSEVIRLAKADFEDSKDLSANPAFGPKGTFNGFKFEQPTGGRIDYIFIKKPVKWEISKYAVLSDSQDNKYPSDHFPVFVEIDLKD